MDEQAFGLKLRFGGPFLEKNGLDFYDGATSLYGFSQALQIVVNAYINNEVLSRATALKGGKMTMGSPRKGSVLVDIMTLVHEHPTAAAFSGKAFYDFVKYALSRACGKLTAKPETPSVQKLAVDETFFDQLSETIEGSLQRAHRAIDHGVNHIILERPRDTLLTFDHQTSQWVNTRDENPAAENFTGNITRYNSISGNARVYVHELKRVLPAKPAVSFPDHKKGLLTWSLHGNTTAGKKELKFVASRIESAQGEPKRLVLMDASQVAPG